MELLSVNPIYPILAFILGIIFIVAGLKIAKWIFWGLAVIAIIAAFLMLFVF